MFKNIQHFENEPVKNYTTFRIGGPAKYFVLPKNLDELKEVLNICKTHNMRYFVIGNGSNILASDKGFDGVIISLKHFNSIKKRKYRGNVYVTCGCGVNLFNLNKYLCENSIEGLEWSYGIPASVGGAIKMNAGAYNHSIGEFVKKIIVLKEGKIKSIKNPKFEYRKSPINDEIVLYAQFSLLIGNKENIKNQMETNLSKRKKSQPYDMASAGSVFKRNGNLFPAKVIDDLGLKGLRLGDAMISKKHTGFIINLGNASFSDISKLIALLKKIFNAFNYSFEEEIIYLI